MPHGRPKIPVALERRVLLEAGHRCAIPTCRYIKTEIHHIIPWSRAKKHEYENLIALCPNCHERATNNEIDRKSLRAYKANLRFAHDKFSQFEMDVLFALVGVVNPIPLPPHSTLLIKRLLDARYVFVTIPGFLSMSHGYQANPDILYLTEKGLDFLRELGIEVSEGMAASAVPMSVFENMYL